MVVQEKYDGMRIQIHKIDKQIKIYSFNNKDIMRNALNKLNNESKTLATVF